MCLVITFRRACPLRVFDSVVMSASDEPVEDGYRTIRYPVVLSGKGRVVEFISADTELEGKAIQKELAAFLGLTAQETTGYRRK